MGLLRGGRVPPRPRDRAPSSTRARQHALNHQGEHFQVVGPLNVSRSPQGQPVIFQAGDSEQGRDLGATIGEGIFTHAATIEQGQAFYNDLKGRAAAKGRDPEEIVIMPGVSVYVGDTDDEAREIELDLQTRDRDFDRALAELGRPFAWHDFRQYDLDAPFPQQALVHAERGFRTDAEKIAKLAQDNGFTLRQTVEFISVAAADPVRRLAGHGRRPDPGVVRGPRPRRPQRRRRPPEPVAPLPRGGRPDPPGARHRPHRVRGHHAARQPGPAGPGEPLHRGQIQRPARRTSPC